MNCQIRMTEWIESAFAIYEERIVLRKYQVPPFWSRVEQL